MPLCYSIFMRGLILLVFIFISTPAYAWTKADTQRQLVYSALHVIDWGQTRDIANRPKEYQEQNLYLGKHPSIQRVDTYFALTLLGHAYISYILPPEQRKIWQYISIGVRFQIVSINYSLGVNIHF